MIINLTLSSNSHLIVLIFAHSHFDRCIKDALDEDHHHDNNHHLKDVLDDEWVDVLGDLVEQQEVSQSLKGTRMAI